MIGIGNQIDDEELMAIAGVERRDKIYKVPDFDRLVDVKEDLFEQIKIGITENGACCCVEV